MAAAETVVSTVNVHFLSKRGEWIKQRRSSSLHSQEKTELFSRPRQVNGGAPPFFATREWRTRR